MRRGAYRHLPWKEQPHVVANPRFPHARGFPVERDVDVPHLYAVGDRVKPNSLWVAERIGGFEFQVVSTRWWREFRRDPWTPQVMVADMPGTWFAASHFKR